MGLLRRDAKVEGDVLNNDTLKILAQKSFILFNFIGCSPARSSHRSIAQSRLEHHGDIVILEYVRLSIAYGHGRSPKPLTARLGAFT